MTITALNEKSITVPYILRQINEDETVDAVVCITRRNGRWETCWSTGIDLGGLSMAAMKLFSDVTDEMHREPREFGSAK